MWSQFHDTASLFLPTVFHAAFLPNFSLSEYFLMWCSSLNYHLHPALPLPHFITCQKHDKDYTYSWRDICPSVIWCAPPTWKLVKFLQFKECFYSFFSCPLKLTGTIFIAENCNYAIKIPMDIVVWRKLAFKRRKHMSKILSTESATHYQMHISLRQNLTNKRDDYGKERQICYAEAISI